jgi:multiple sugar transport system permease protein
VVTSPVAPTRLSLIDNFVAVLSDFRLPGATVNVLIYLVVWLPTLLVVVFVLALVMDAKRTRFAALTRFVVYLPGAVTGAAAALLWLFMFSPGVSPLGPLLSLVTQPGQSFLSDQTLVIVLTVMGVAAASGGWVVVVFGALVAIPDEIIESARLDGASAWQLVRHIKLPLIRSHIVFILIVASAQGFQVFVEPTVLAQGAPGQISSTWSINQLVFSYATGEANYGRASALAIMLLAICVGLAVLVITRTRFYSVDTR